MHALMSHVCMLLFCTCDFTLQAFINHGNEGRELCQGTDSFNNYLLHIACKHGNQATLKVMTLILWTVLRIVIFLCGLRTHNEELMHIVHCLGIWIVLKEKNNIYVS